jgi:hypothetical protein
MTTTTAPGIAFHRELPDYITIAVDGTMTEVDPDIASPPARVVITMQDDTAHLLAHLFGQVAHLSRILDWLPEVGVIVPDLAAALHQAAEHARRKCRYGGLDLPAAEVMGATATAAPDLNGRELLP